ncbi:SID1 transmembrane family member 1-like [Macrosteles quadrilineatus]|uniref:SID1 transmembrane family member 1-like n=1 Tax=Macrosteles quadrilineatus TaxID=74068 RepID=UPI0023E16008|nr:SID1 transmembrane family member 1-like [Macrosteles quadrilineatus]
MDFSILGFLVFIALLNCSFSYIPRICQNQPSNANLGLEQFNPVVCDAKFDQRYEGTINNTCEYIYVFPVNKNVTLPPRVTVSSHLATPDAPLLVVVTQLKSILSWEVPLVTQGPQGNFTYNQTSRTLCPNPSGEQSDVVVTISTRSSSPIQFVLWVNITKDFDLELSKNYTIAVSPSEPQFYRFKFADDVSSALLHVSSDDAPCMTLSIQNNSCPVYDLEKTIQYRGLWQTVVTKGGIFLRKAEFPVGLFVVFVVHSTKEACHKFNTGADHNQTKTVQFALEKSISEWDYIVAVCSVLIGFLIIYMTVAVLVCLSNRTPSNQCSQETQVAVVVSTPVLPYIPSNCATTPSSLGSPWGTGYDDDSDLDDTEVDMLHDASEQTVILRTKKILCLDDVAQKNPRVLSLKSNQYLWNMLTVAVFYALPVVQLVFTYQSVLISSGNQDLCYYNFLCSHRLLFMSDFNHVFSNIGYLLFGVLFLLLTYRRQRLCHSVGHHLGIPYHYGMFYALGVALCMEGVLSACYHLCPNHSNFQFDTSFMYVLSILSMVKIYQTRHPDITASAYTFFGVLALVIFLGMFGVLNGQPWFYVVFTGAHLLTCLVITAQIYHVGTWKLNFGVFSRVSNSFKNDYGAGGLRGCLMPLYPARMILLLLANLGNWGLVAMGYFLHLGDFATYMLSIFLANLFMYFIFYIVMKRVSKEKIYKAPLTYTVLAFMFWGAGCYFFYHKSISWKLTPAESRAFNQRCEILNFYDKHDIWHFLSAGALFFSFMILLTLDDDLAEKDRREISVF